MKNELKKHEEDYLHINKKVLSQRLLYFIFSLVAFVFGIFSIIPLMEETAVNFLLPIIFITIMIGLSLVGMCFGIFASDKEILE